MAPSGIGDLEGVELLRYNQKNVLDQLVSIDFKKDLVKSSKDALQVCIIKNIELGAANLSDQRTNLLNTQSYYKTPVISSDVVGDSDVLKFLSEDGNRAMANGQIQYSYSLQSGFVSVPIVKYVRFTLDIKIGGTSNNYSFTNLKIAQSNTGVVANHGFVDVPDSVGSGTMNIYHKFKQLSDNINRCLLIENS